MLSNPGGLWGLTASQLGVNKVSSARNGYLSRICQNVRTVKDQRVIELLSDGIRIVLDRVKAAGMVPPQFLDQGIRFTVIMPNNTLLAKEDLDWLSQLSDARTLSDKQRHALVAMRHGQRWNNRTLRAELPMDSSEARTLLADLVERKLAIAVGDNKGRTYELAPELVAVAPDLVAVAPEPGLEPAAEEIVTKRPYVSRKITAARVVEVLKDGPTSVKELSSMLQLTPRQVGYALADLESSKTVRRESDNSVVRYSLIA